MVNHRGHVTSSCATFQLLQLRHVQRTTPGCSALLAMLSAPPVRDASDGGIAIALPAGGSYAPPSALWRGEANSEHAAAEGRGLQPQRRTAASVTGHWLQVCL